MKFSVALFIVFVLCALAFASPTAKQRFNKNEKRAAKNAIEHKSSIEHKRSAAKTSNDWFDGDSLKKTINTGARNLNLALERIIPLAQSGARLCTDLTQRFIQGPTKEGRAYDEKLVRRFDDFSKQTRGLVADTFAAAKAYKKGAAFFERVASLFAF